MRVILIAAALLPGAAEAQDDPAFTNKVLAAATAMGQELSAPELPASLPPTPQRMQLMRQYLTRGPMKEGMRAAHELSYTKLKANMVEMIKGIPKSQQSQAVGAFTNAFDAAMATREKKALDETAVYFASRMTDDELRTVLDFYSTDLGAKSQQGVQALSVDERQQIGRFTIDHPAMLKFVKIGIDYVKGRQARRQAYEAAFDVDLNTRLCNNLTSIHLKLTSCPSPFRQVTRRPVNLAQESTASHLPSQSPAYSSSPPSLVLGDDYPPLALRMNHEGRVAYHLEYGPDGRGTNCTVTASSGYAELDGTTCSIMMRRARFAPGKPGTYDSSITWKIPSSPSSAPVQPSYSAQSTAAYEQGKAQAEAAMAANQR